MPILAANRGLYPPDWPAIARQVKERAHWHCQRCGARHGAWGSRDRQGRFLEVSPSAMSREGHGKPPFRRRLSRGGFVKVVEVVLAACHVDQNPVNCDLANLRAWCQHCHLDHDEGQHVRNAGATRRRSMGTPDLF